MNTVKLLSHGNIFKKNQFLENWALGKTKDTTLERADFTLQLLMFATAEKDQHMFMIFFLPIFCQLLSPRL